MDRVARLAEVTDLMSESERIAAFDAADVGVKELQDYVIGLNQYSFSRRERLISAIKGMYGYGYASVVVYSHYDVPVAPTDGWSSVFSLRNDSPSDTGNLHLIFCHAWGTTNLLISLGAGEQTSVDVADYAANTRGLIVAVAVNASGKPIEFNHWGHGGLFMQRTAFASPLYGPYELRQSPTILSECKTASFVGSDGVLTFDGVKFEKLPTTIDYCLLSEGAIVSVGSLGGDISNDGDPNTEIGDVDIVLTNEIGSTISFTHTQSGSLLAGKLINIFNNPPNEALYLSDIKPIIEGHICNMRASVSGSTRAIIGSACNPTNIMPAPRPVHSNAVGATITLKIG